MFQLYNSLIVCFSSIHACLLVKALLRNFVNQEKCPTELYKNTTDSVGAIANMTASLACKYLWSLVFHGSLFFFSFRVQLCRFGGVIPSTTANDLRLRRVSIPDLANDLRLRRVSIPDLANDLRLRRVSIPDLANDLRLRRVSIPDLDNDLRLRRVSIPDFIHYLRKTLRA